MCASPNEHQKRPPGASDSGARSQGLVSSPIVLEPLAMAASRRHPLSSQTRDRARHAKQDAPSRPSLSQALAPLESGSATLPPCRRRRAPLSGIRPSRRPGLCTRARDPVRNSGPVRRPREW